MVDALIDCYMGYGCGFLEDPENWGIILFIAFVLYMAALLYVKKEDKGENHHRRRR